jgi:AcrR family transcriptional regulator
MAGKLRQVAIADIEGSWTPRRVKREATRRAIMDALESLLKTSSYEEVRIEDLMAVAGLTRTAFYRYFPDLESVLLAWIEIIGTEFNLAADLWLSVDVDPDDGLLAAMTGLADVWARHGGLMRGIFDAATTGSSVQFAWRNLVESFLGPVRQRLDDLSRQRRISLPDTAETARALVWMTERYFFETIARELGVLPDEAAATLADIWRRVLFSHPD